MDYIEILNFEEMSRFVNLWTVNGKVVQRAAFLIGRFEDDPNFPSGKKAVVEAMYVRPELPPPPPAAGSSLDTPTHQAHH